MSFGGGAISAEAALARACTIPRFGRGRPSA